MFSLNQLAAAKAVYGAAAHPPIGAFLPSVSRKRMAVSNRKRIA
jgi:hypothetical protein